MCPREFVEYGVVLKRATKFGSPEMSRFGHGSVAPLSRRQDTEAHIVRSKSGSVANASVTLLWPASTGRFAIVDSVCG